MRKTEGLNGANATTRQERAVMALSRLRVEFVASEYVDFFDEKGRIRFWLEVDKGKIVGLKVNHGVMARSIHTPQKFTECLLLAAFPLTPKEKK